jgi:asparagine N-glycosylation enzyme membrane subunit Stt3
MSNISENLQNFRKIAAHGVSLQKSGVLDPTFNPLATMYYRLYIQDGSAYAVGNLDLPALGTYRLVFESVHGTHDQLVGPVSHYKIFEKVNGALLQGVTRAGARVSLKLSVRSPAGRIFTYQDWTDAGQHGEYTFRVPYATTAGNGDTTALAPCMVTAAGKIFTAHVAESDVITGRKVNLH